MDALKGAKEGTPGYLNRAKNKSVFSQILMSAFVITSLSLSDIQIYSVT